MMKTNSDSPIDRFALRARVVTHLKGSDARTSVGADASAALRVLYDLASSPSTAADALALLHELQVHQVELEIQGEELRRSRDELEELLNRQVQLHEHAPAGLLTLDFNAVMLELNHTAAALIGVERGFLRGRSLDTFLTPESAQTLRAMVGRVGDCASAESADLHLREARNGTTPCLHASVRRDPAGGGCLVALVA